MIKLERLLDSNETFSCGEVRELLEFCEDLLEKSADAFYRNTIRGEIARLELERASSDTKKARDFFEEAMKKRPSFKGMVSTNVASQS